jgi:hypothetical protein
MPECGSGWQLAVSNAFILDFDWFFYFYFYFDFDFDFDFDFFWRKSAENLRKKQEKWVRGGCADFLLLFFHVFFSSKFIQIHGKKKKIVLSSSTAKNNKKNINTSQLGSVGSKKKKKTQKITRTKAEKIPKKKWTRDNTRTVFS